MRNVFTCPMGLKANLIAVATAIGIPVLVFFVAINS